MNLTAAKEHIASKKKKNLDRLLGKKICYNDKGERLGVKLAPDELVDNLYRDLSILNFVLGDDETKKTLEAPITFGADWFEHPHPQGRDIRGEADFQAVRLVPLLFECPESLTEGMKNSLERFFLRRDYSSVYQSENHALMYRVARYLAAQFYRGKTFEQFGMTAEQVLETDRAYFKEFYDFRAGKGWGEFDSICYGGEIMLLTMLLYNYAEDKTVKRRAAMTMDIILLDMILDGRNGIYGGAHGRIYENNALYGTGTMLNLYDFYFGSPFEKESDSVASAFLLSDYVPSEIVYEIEANRTYPFENREMKHLHSTGAWIGAEINHDLLNILENQYINKYTYVDEDYILGAVNHQDPYPEESPDRWYSHHQQHEWDLSLSGAREDKIFSHHPGDPGYHHIHNRWTGDHGCLCSTHYSNKNTAVSIYNIEKEEQYPYINACVPFAAFDEKRFAEKNIYLKYKDRLYISVYFDNGYRFTDDEKFKDVEIISDGRQNCVVVRVEKADKFEDMREFIRCMDAKQVVFDREKLTVDFDGIKVWYHGNSEKSVENVYPYGMTYDSPYMSSVWNSRVIECKIGDKKVIYDFNNDCVKEVK